MDKWWKILRQKRNCELMERCLFVILVSFLQSCDWSNANISKELPSAIIIQNTDSEMKNNNGTWLFKGKAFNGYIIEKTGKVVTAKLPVINGKEHGLAYGWYATGQLRYNRNFLNGNRDGIHKGWYDNGMPAFEYFFKNEKYEGEQTTFFKNGNKWQILNYVNGYEEGKQKMWNVNGKVVNNFTVKNGKLYGVIGRFDCMSVQNN